MQTQFTLTVPYADYQSALREACRLAYELPLKRRTRASVEQTETVTIVETDSGAFELRTRERP